MSKTVSIILFSALTFVVYLPILIKNSMGITDSITTILVAVLFIVLIHSFGYHFKELFLSLRGYKHYKLLFYYNVVALTSVAIISIVVIAYTYHLSIGGLEGIALLTFLWAIFIAKAVLSYKESKHESIFTN